MKQDYLDMVRQVVDHEVVDVDNFPCGMVDDLEIEGAPGKQLKVTAILVGVGAWSNRLPGLFRFFARKLFGTQRTRVPWEQVLQITETVKLKSRASEVGLGKADRKAEKWIKVLPKS